jgi:hypothetical protein
MIPFLSRLFRCAGLPLAAVLLLFSGCQSALDFPTAGGAWQTYTGQMHFGGVRSVIGDVVVRRSGASDFQLAFSTGPGVPLMRLWESGDRARTEGALSRGAFSGNPAHAPSHLRGWLSLREVFAAVPAQGGKFSGSFGSAEAQVVGGRLQHLTVSTSVGDRFTFHFGS